MQQRSVALGYEWAAGVQAALGTPFWDHRESLEDYVVTILVATSITAPSVLAAKASIRAVTPAHLDIEYESLTRFIVGDADDGVVGEDFL